MRSFTFSIWQSGLDRVLRLMLRYLSWTVVLLYLALLCWLGVLFYWWQRGHT